MASLAVVHGGARTAREKVHHAAVLRPHPLWALPRAELARGPIAPRHIAPRDRWRVGDRPRDAVRGPDREVVAAAVEHDVEGAHRNALIDTGVLARARYSLNRASEPLVRAGKMLRKGHSRAHLAKVGLGP